MRTLAYALALAAAFSADAAAESGTPTELQCEFGYFASAVAHSDSRYFTADVLRASEDDYVTFRNMDLGIGRAQIAGVKVDSDLVLFAERQTTWTFTEFTDRGDTYITQVFRESEPGAQNDVYRVVRSKQWTEFGSVYGMQYYGLCLAVY